MARPPSQGAKPIAKDIQDLTRILNRFESDTHRPKADKERITRCIKEVLGVLIVGERAGDKPARKTGT